MGFIGLESENDGSISYTEFDFVDAGGWGDPAALVKTYYSSSKDVVRNLIEEGPFSILGKNTEESIPRLKGERGPFYKPHKEDFISLRISDGHVLLFVKEGHWVKAKVTLDNDPELSFVVA